MNTQSVKNLMVPLSEYATVPMDASLSEAMLALEKAIESFDPARHQHRAILVYDENDHVVGKINQINILQALEPGYAKIIDNDSFSRLGLAQCTKSQ